jgi:hypothetical protein
MKINRSFCGGFRGAVFSKRAPLAAGGKLFSKQIKNLPLYFSSSPGKFARSSGEFT